MNPIRSENIYQIFDSLPEDKKKEVYDFIEFLKAQANKHRAKKKEIINKVYGLTRGSNLTAELFSKMKAEEIALEDKR